MTDTRRDFLRRFAAAALASAGAGCDVAPDGGNFDRQPEHRAVYGAPPFAPTQISASIGDRVFFDHDKATLSPDAKQILNRLAEWLRQESKLKIEIQGHTDERGTREYNLALGGIRADSIKAYLVASGIAADRITTVSFGKERPAAFGSNERAWAENRRCVIVIAK